MSERQQRKRSHSIPPAKAQGRKKPLQCNTAEVDGPSADRLLSAAYRFLTIANEMTDEAATEEAEGAGR